MGLDADEDEFSQIINGDFNGGFGWFIPQWWTIAGGKLRLNRLGAFDNTAFQFITGLQVGNVYTITFTIDSINFGAEPASGVHFHAGLFESQYFSTPGIKAVEFIGQGIPSNFGFNTDRAVIGDQCVIDQASLTVHGDHIGDVLGINWARLRRKEYFTFAGTRRNQILASRFDKSNCLIAFDV